jgi:very-short-patch-repair endonuclease
MSEFRGRLEQTRRKLLDLTKRNKLINYKGASKTRNLKIIDESLEFIYQHLVCEEEAFRFEAIPQPQFDSKYFDLKEEINVIEASLSFSSDENIQKELKEKIEQLKNKAKAIEDEVLITVEVQAKRLGFPTSNQMPEIELESILDNEAKYLDDILQTLHYPNDLEKILKKIELSARSIIEESGSNMLYLILGVLEWTESKNSEVKVKSPLISVPVSLKRGKLNKETSTYEYILEYNGDLIDTNKSLSEKLKNDFNLRLPEITEEISFNKYIREVQKICENRENWKIKQEVSLDFLQFGKILMYKDLDTNNWDDDLLENNQVLQDMFLGKETSGVSYAPKEYDIDKDSVANNIPLVMDADSSQHSAIVDVMNGKNVVIEGPPGTGKSQTISNMVAVLIADGKSVLFVSEKLAALEVVYQRLSDVGLGDFCLELHSHKTQKLKVLENIKKRIDGDYQIPSQLEVVKHQIEHKKDELRDYLDVLHSEYGESKKKIFEIFWLVEKYRDSSQYLKFEINNVKDLSIVNMHEHVEKLEEYRKFHENYLLDEFYWNGFDTYKLSFIDTDKFINLLKNLKEEYLVLDYTLEKLSYKLDNEYDELEFLSEFSEKFIFDSNLYDVKILKALSLNENKLNQYLKDYDTFIQSCDFDTDNINKILKYAKKSLSIIENIVDISDEINHTIIKYKDFIEKSEKNNDSYKNIFDKISESIYLESLDEVNIEDIISMENTIEAKKNSFFKFLSSNYKNAKNKVQSFLLEPLAKDNSLWLFIFRDIKTYFKVKKEQDKLFIELQEESNTFLRKITNFNKTIVETIKINEYILNSSIEENVKNRLLGGLTDIGMLNDVSKTFSRIVSINYELNSYGKLEKTFFGRENLKVSDCIEKLNHIDKHVKELDVWSNFKKISNSIILLGLEKSIQSIEKKELPLEKLVSNFYYNFYHSLLVLAFREYEILNSFNRLSHEEVIKNFKRLDIELLVLNKEYAAAKASHRNMPMSQGGGSVKTFTNLKLLEHEISKKKRHIPIRQLIKRAGKAIQSLKPCFMMSPLSVAQYLPPSLLHFDVLLIDEASQLRPEEALGVIARASQVVIVGDPKQLPPTSFFDAIKDDSEDNDNTIVDESESILDSCIDLYSPVRRLKWHYRSQHESLIDFSNKQFYDNDLIVFPSPTSISSEELGVKHTFVEKGVYHSGSTARYNKEEAKVVVSHIEKQMKDFSEKSLGVGTFNMTQRDLIQNMIDEKEKENPYIANYIAKWKDTSEPFFIKNLESLQGDERDAIFISTTFGKDKETGRVMQRFGPINLDNGWRRLNVLVTRAKQKIHIFTSLQSTDIIISETSSRGIMAFRSFLKYLETKQLMDTPIITDKGFDSPFEESVYQLLSDIGVKAVPQVGVSGYFIDLAVKAEESNDYILAIECDGATYHSSKSARDRDRLKEEVLTRLGWKVYRIWSTDWFKNRDNEVAKLIKIIKDEQLKYTENCKSKIDKNISLD